MQPGEAAVRPAASTWWCFIHPVILIIMHKTQLLNYQQNQLVLKTFKSSLTVSVYFDLLDMLDKTCFGEASSFRCCCNLPVLCVIKYWHNYVYLETLWRQGGLGHQVYILLADICQKGEKKVQRKCVVGIWKSAFLGQNCTQSSVWTMPKLLCSL